jgi:hypothetical protein
MSALDKYPFISTPNGAAVAVDPEEMAGLLIVAECAQRVIEWWRGDGDHHGEITDLIDALEEWGGFE